MSRSFRSMIGCALFVAACSSNNAETSLVTISPAGPNATCPNGGTVISTGVDTNGDGTLGSDEVTATQEVCNGGSGSTGSGAGGELVSIDDQTGSNCPDGGTRIQTGDDTNGDGVLEASEVTSTQYVCNQLPENTYYIGNVDLGSAADLVPVLPYGAVIGDVTVEPTYAGDLDWPALSVVTGSFTIDETDGDGSAISIELPDLAQVGGFELYDRDGLTTLALDSLVSAGDLDLEENPDLTTASFAKLANTQVEVDDNDVLTSLAFTGSTALSSIDIGHNPELTSLDLSSLATVTGDLTILYNDLDSLSMPALTAIGGGLHVYYEGLATLSAPSLATVADSVIISSDENLGSADLSGLTSIGGDLRIRDNDVLASFDLTALSTVAGELVIESNPDLTTLTAPSLTSVSDFYVDGNEQLSTCGVADVLTGLYAHMDPTTVSIDIEDNLDDGGSCTPTDYCITKTFADITGTFHFCAPGLLDTAVAWSDAETTCETFTGGALATFGSAAEWTDFQADLGSAFAGGIDGWLGYTDAVTEGTWLAPDGSTPGYSPATDPPDTAFWDDTQPDGGTDENCAEHVPDGYVNDLSCTSTLGLFVCRN